ncbi:MAG: DUF1292 domain-containing protein [Lachnospiraceae bacterium]|nr:DUF1292 domain-containing protein [Lachnospiraceae bacterium]
MEQFEKITFVPEGEEEEVSFYILDQAKLGGTGYLLVTDEDPEEEREEGEAGAAYVMKDVAGPDDIDSVYEFVEEDEELHAVCVLFKDALKELGIELEE